MHAKRKHDEAFENKIQKQCLDTVRPMDCKTPRSFSKQTVVSSPLMHLDDTNSVIYIEKDVLDPEQLEAYLEQAVKVKRTSGKSAFGSMKPRLEICYSPDGSPYVYSGISHPTIAYPEHVRKAMDIISTRIKDELSETIPYTVPSSAVDILYDDTFPRGGSISEHKDNEDPAWGMVWIFSLGQSRYLRIRRDSDGAFFNVKMGHNSLVVMLGETFQKKYTHRVDKLAKNEPVGARLSLNVRYKKP